MVETTKSRIPKQGSKNLDNISDLVMLNVGTILDGKYEIKRKIAKGGMSIVYEAYHKYTQKRVAIKIIPIMEEDPIQLKRFQKELEAYSLLSHPNVITIYDAGIYDNFSVYCKQVPYIVMEYIEGVDICTYVKQQEEKNTPKDSKDENGNPKERDWKLCARLIYETALGLEYIHSQKMIHRDIKPSNIIIKTDGTPVIIDLGLVKFNRRQSYNLTQNKEIIGSLEYMPIEQFKGDKKLIDERTDVYSLGLVLYELLTGEIAYNGDNLMESCYKILYYDPPYPRKINPEIPEVLEEITIHATEKQREKRYGSMKEFADALKEYLDDKTVNPNYEQKANQGYAIAQYFLGNQYYLGKKLAQDDKQAVYWWTKAAQQGHVDAQSNLGSMYYYGKGITQNIPKALYWWAKAANQGHVDAQSNLGAMYYYGKGVAKDLGKALYWLEKAASQGYIEAQYNLGVIYLKRKASTEGIEKAVYWLEKAASQGHAPSQYNLGAMYYYGKGVAKDIGTAVYWLEKSANQGYAPSQYNLGVMYLKGKGVSKDTERAIYWLQQIALQGDAEIQYKLGVMYLKGEGVPIDTEKAICWLEKAANQGISYSQYKLGFMYFHGKDVIQDTEKAIYWLEKAANQGDSSAQYLLGKQYYLGKKLPKDIERAIYYLQQARENKDITTATKASKILTTIYRKKLIQ